MEPNQAHKAFFDLALLGWNCDLAENDMGREAMDVEIKFQVVGTIFH